jgi:hypothetical protein
MRFARLAVLSLAAFGIIAGVVLHSKTSVPTGPGGNPVPVCPYKNCSN